MARGGDLATLGDGRYSLLKKLGEGGRGVVYKALDVSLDRVVAIKVLKPEVIDDQTYARFVNEAKLAARLSHPNIAAVYDIGKDDERPFLVMELIDGPSLRGLLEADGGSGLDLATAARIAQESCMALEYAHAHGVLHRDIKPENIMLTKDGRAKLMDFGLARALDKPRITAEGMMVGSPGYMAPENALGRESDERSDLYSFGAVLYEMATGSAPFRSQDSLKLIYSHIHDPPIPPTRINPTLPASLEKIILRLLAKDPAGRYRSASELLRALGSLPGVVPVGAQAASVSTLGFTEETPPSRKVPSPEPRRILPFVGRDAEMATLNGYVDQVLRGEGATVLITGEAGIGKSRVSEEMKAYATLRGFRILTGNCLEAEGSAPDHPWVQVIRTVVRQATAQSLHRACGLYADELARLVPEIADKVPLPPASPIGAHEPQRVRLIEGVAQFFVNLSQASPLLIEISDLNWADSASVELFLHVARAVRNQFILLCGSYRDIEVVEDSALSRVLLDLNRERLGNLVHLRRLDPSGVARMIAETFGELEVTPDFHDLVYERTDGNPFFVEEVLRSLVEEGVIFRTDTGWDLKPISEIEVPATVRNVIRRRLSRLDEESQHALRAASVIGNEFSFEVLQQVTGIEEGLLLDLVEKGLKYRLLKERKLPAGRSSYIFADRQIRNALYEEISLVRRRRFHQKTAQALEILSDGKTHRFAGELAHHYMLGNDVGKALEYSIAAADDASQLYAHEEAAKHCQNALELLEANPDDSLRARVLEQLGDELQNLPRAGEALKAWEQAIEIYERLGNRIRAGDLRRRTVRFHLKKQQKLETLLEARRMLEGESESTELARLYATLGWFYWADSQASAAREMCHKTLELAGKVGAHEPEAMAYETLCMLAPPSEKSKLFEYGARILKIGRECNLPKLIGTGCVDLAFAHVWLRGDCQEGLKCLQEGIEVARKVRDMTMEMELAGSAEPWILLLAGDLDRAERQASAGFDFYARHYPTPHAANLCVLGHIALVRGELDRAEQYLTTDLSYLLEEPLGFIRDTCCTLLGRLYLERGDLGKAIEHLTKAYGYAKELGWVAFNGMFNAMALSLLIEARLKAPEAGGSTRLVPELAEELSNLTRQLDEDVIRAWNHRTQGMVAIHANERSKAVESLEESVRLWRKIGWPYELAKALYELGALHQSQGDRKRASGPLNEALGIFTRLKAHLDVERVLARKELLNA